MDATLSRKAVKAARLAAGEAALGHDEAAQAQGRIAGELAARAGMTLAELNAAVGPLLHAPVAAPAWDAVVDGWYDAQPKEVTQAEVDAVLAWIRASGVATDLTGSPGDAHAIVTRMWSELQRRRG